MHSTLKEMMHFLVLQFKQGRDMACTDFSWTLAACSQQGNVRWHDHSLQHGCSCQLSKVCKMHLSKSWQKIPC